MNPLRGPAAVRLALWTLATASFALALAQPAAAGTEAAPEIQDPAGDQAVAMGGGPAPCDVNCVGNGVDVVTVWIDNETATQFNVNIRTTADIVGGQPFPVGGTPVPNVGADIFNAHFSIGADEYQATVSMAGGTPTMSNAAHAVTVAANLMTVTLLKADVGDPAAGAVMTGFHVEATRELSEGQVFLTDTAPDDGEDAGVTYTFTGGGPAGTPGDTDGDGLNDTCEQQYFGGLNSTANATGDADGDGLTNGQECVLGTDPTKADTDGDGTNDKDDPAPTDPTQGGTSSSSTSTSHSSSTSTSRSSSTTGSHASSSNSKGSVTDFAGAIDRLQSDAGYVGMSAGGFLAVLVLCIVGLAVRWSL
jgi:hypothetical protein